MNKIFDWIMFKIFPRYVFYIYKKKLSLGKVNKFEQYIWNRYFAEDFHDFIEKNT